MLLLPLAIALVPPISLALLAPAAALVVGGREWRRTETSGASLVLPFVAAVGSVILMGFAVVASGDPLLLGRSVVETPALLGGLAPVVGGLGLLVVGAMVAPWPLRRWGPGVMLVPAAVVLAHRLAWELVPVGIAGWVPALMLLLVPSVMFALLRHQWPTALGTLGLLASLRPEGLAIGVAAVSTVAAVLLTLQPVEADRAGKDGVIFPSVSIGAALTVLALAGGIAVVMRDEVVLATMLAASATVAAARRRKSPSPGSTT